MTNIVEVSYGQTGQSTSINELGMREMQARAYAKRNSQYLLIKSPPASGKSRALMFLGLDKLRNQGLKKVIVAVPERAIGSSFSKTKLKKYGFFEDWSPKDEWNLCTPGGASRKVPKFKEFMESNEEILICTHSTLRFACESIEDVKFNDTVLAIDEFHHVSADDGNRLGDLLRAITKNSTAHVVAMTGSYFRGDSVPILLPADERKFTKVTYNYYEQLNGYDFLKSLGIGYHFYQGKYTEAIMEVLDTDKKTILHIPSVNSGESTKDKHNEVDFILDEIGDVIGQDKNTGVILLKRHTDGKKIKVADLVDDRPNERNRIVDYLRNIKKVDDMDLIIALGMAKEGFDWPFCEHALTVGYRGSLTEIIQIIGRATRDSENKNHAQFTNLIAQPDAKNEEVMVAVNNMLKAITASLLMEQVLAPNWKFKTKISDEDKPQEGEIKIKGFKEPSTQRVKNIVESDLNDLKAAIMQNSDMLKAMPGNVDPEVMNAVIIPKIIREKYPDCTEEEIEELRQHVVVDSVIKNGTIRQEGDKRFVNMAGRFVDIDDLHIDLIDQVNPFQRAFEVLSKSVTSKVLKVIKDTIDGIHIKMTEEEAILLFPKIKEFIKQYNKKPDIESTNPQERRMAEAIIFLNNEKRKRKANGNA